MMWLLGFKPRARNRWKRLQHTPHLVVLACEITSHLTMEKSAQSVNCDDYSFALVANKVLIERS